MASMVIRGLVFLYICVMRYSLAGCPFQNPFWFYHKPVVVEVYDENGEMEANKIRIIWIEYG